VGDRTQELEKKVRKRWINTDNKDFHNKHSSPNNIKMIIPRRMRY
jgi:hypothetical protein